MTSRIMVRACIMITGMGSMIRGVDRNPGLVNMRHIQRRMAMGNINMAVEITISELSIRKSITHHNHQLFRTNNHSSMTPDDPQTRCGDCNV